MRRLDADKLNGARPQDIKEILDQHNIDDSENLSYALLQVMKDLLLEDQEQALRNRIK